MKAATITIAHKLHAAICHRGTEKAQNKILYTLLTPLMLSFILGGFTASISEPAAALGNIDITVQTTECSGDTGFSSFFSSDLYKIQAADCSDPNEPGKKLQQVLLKSSSGISSYDILWVTENDAKDIMQQIKEGRKAKLKHLTKPEVLIKKETIIKYDRPVIPENYRSATKPPKSTKREELAGPSIRIIDPPITNTRSITNVITPVGTKGRLIVGKIDAPAGLLSLTINGQPNNVDSQGLFKVSIPVNKRKTPVSIVAVDKQGKRSTIEFRLLPESQQEEQLATDDTGNKPNMDIFGKYYALIIANNQYEKLDDLATPINDADVIGDILKKKYGFTVTKLYNSTRYKLLSAMNIMRRDLTEKDNLLIYYAGHGEYDQTNNRGHWLPVDAEHNSTANWISTIAITDIINTISAKHVLVITDSCYSGALTRSVNAELDPGMSEDARMKWLRIMAKTRTRYVLTSGGIKPVLDDGGNGHSIFANALIKTLDENKGILEGSKLYREVKSQIMVRAEELNVEQIPQYAKLKRTDHEFGEFLFVGNQ